MGVWRLCGRWYAHPPALSLVGDRVACAGEKVKSDSQRRLRRRFQRGPSLGGGVRRLGLAAAAASWVAFVLVSPSLQRLKESHRSDAVKSTAAAVVQSRPT